MNLLRRFSPASPLFSLALFASAIASGAEEAKAKADDAAEKTAAAAAALTLDAREAVLRALEQSTALRVERLRPERVRTAEAQERAAFDPALSAEVSVTREEKEVEKSGQERSDQSGESEAAGVTIEEFLPTGTRLSLGVDRQETEDDGSGAETSRMRYTLSTVQSLLRGLGPGVNLASLRQARLATRISRYELRGFAEALAEEAERAYWKCFLAEKRVEISRRSLELAEAQRDEVHERIRLGQIAAAEAAAAEAEMAQRREALLQAQADHETARLALLRHILGREEPTWDLPLSLRDDGSLPEVKPPELAWHLAAARLLRPDLAEARLQVERGDLEVLRTRNGLLPRLDLFITLGRTLYAESFAAAADGESRSRDFEVGLRLSHVLGNRAERAAQRRAALSAAEARAALANAMRLAEVDVRTAWATLAHARARISATAATRAAREESLRAETEKFRVGKSVSLLVAQAQRELMASQVEEVAAVVAYRQAVAAFYRLTGTLLLRYGISVPEAAAEEMPPME